MFAWKILLFKSFKMLLLADVSCLHLMILNCPFLSYLCMSNAVYSYYFLILGKFSLCNILMTSDIAWYIFCHIRVFYVVLTMVTLGNNEIYFSLNFFTCWLKFQIFIWSISCRHSAVLSNWLFILLIGLNALSSSLPDK